MIILKKIKKQQVNKVSKIKMQEIKMLKINLIKQVSKKEKNAWNNTKVK